ncbi:hypothetical protein L208DRAFT_161084 [Tricholoma matsutake]|nr:hypothetical protein L208DRAFT_161084 [Tricholoma matsutake 945]
MMTRMTKDHETVTTRHPPLPRSKREMKGWFSTDVFPSTAVQPRKPLLVGGLVFLFFNLFFSISISISFFYFYFILLHHGCEQLLTACKCN